MKSLRMHRPPHPGEILRELCLEPLNLSVTDAAASLDVSRNALSAVLNGRAGISPEMAIRLSIAFDTTAEVGCISRCSMISGTLSSRASVFVFGNWRRRKHVVSVRSPWYGSACQMRDEGVSRSCCRAFYENRSVLTRFTKLLR